MGNKQCKNVTTLSIKQGNNTLYYSRDKCKNIGTVKCTGQFCNTYACDSHPMSSYNHCKWYDCNAPLCNNCAYKGITICKYHIQSFQQSGIILQ
jgi:hypothetical protein